MNPYLYRYTLFIALSFLTVSAFAQVSKEITGITTRILPYATKTMAEIVKNDDPQTVAYSYTVPLKPDLEGPTPVQNPNALQTPIVSQYNRNTGEKVETGTQSIHSNFLAIWGSYHNNIPGRESAYTPPDNCGDVGTTQLIATANTRMKVFDKPSANGTAATTPTGTSTQTLPAIYNVNLNTFFSNSSLNISNISDPHVRFDRLSKRWFIVAIDVDHNTNNYCCIAVSNSDVITDATSFKFYYFNISGTGGNANEFFDYPTLGIDKFALNIGGNMFQNALTYAGVNMWVINKDSILSNVLKVTIFSHNQSTTDLYTPQGVHNDDPNASGGYFIGASSTVYSKLILRKVNHTSPVPTLSADIALMTQQTYGPDKVIIPFLDSIDGNDHRLCAAMIMKNKLTGTNSLWTAQGTLTDATGSSTPLGDRDGIAWFEISKLDSTPSIVQQSKLFNSGTITANSLSYIYPTIATSGQGHSIMGFSSSGRKKFPQASVAGRYRTDPSGFFQAPVDLTNDSSRYNPGASRWGDYTQTVVDPLDNMTMWTFTQYADTINSWGVRAAQLIAPPPSTPKLDTIPVCNTSKITISGIAVNNSEFFDPGDDPNGPGFSRLKIIVTGPSNVTATNIKFINQDTLTASFNLPEGTLAGTYTINVINPDGQSASTSFVLAKTCSKVIITIVDFSGKKIKEGVQLDWITSNEQEIKNFIIEKSGDSINFVNFATVNAKGTSGGNNNYSIIDHRPFPNNSFYRLKIYNNEGNFLYSRIIKIATDQKNIAITRIYPNPASSDVTLEFFTTLDATVNLNVFDFQGRKVLQELFQLVQGFNKRSLNVAALARAGYILQFSDANNNIIEKIRILKQ